MFDSVFQSDEVCTVSPDDGSREEKLRKTMDEVFGVPSVEKKDEQITVNEEGMCSSDCPNKTCFSSSVSITLTRERINRLSTSELHQFLLSRLNTQAEMGLDSLKCFVFQKIQYCHKSVRVLFGISKYMIETCIKDHLAGKTFNIHGNKGSFYSCQNRDLAISFILNFAKMHAENMPDREVLRLPHYLNIRELFCCICSSKRTTVQRISRISSYLHSIGFWWNEIFLKKSSSHICPLGRGFI